MSFALLGWLGLVNLIAFAAFGIDKYKAKRGIWRTRERTLLLLAVIGGSVGAYFGMYVFRHKTQHVKFKYGVPLIFLLQLALVLYVHMGHAL